MPASHRLLLLGPSFFWHGVANLFLAELDARWQKIPVSADGKNMGFLLLTKTPRFFFESKSKGFFFSESAGLEELYDVACVCQNMSIGTSNLN